jgi:Ca-activated chloride channel family protein
VHDVIPGGEGVPDLFEGDQLVVLGRYAGEGPLAFTLSGNYLGRQRTFEFAFNLDGATVKNGFVPRLWASRRIGVLVDAIRQMGADGDPARPKPATADPRVKELVDEIVRLSTEFGVLTEYTAFLAREGTDLSKRDAVLQEAARNFAGRALATRSGLSSVNQEWNGQYMRGQNALNARNVYLDQDMNRVSVSTVQQVGDRTYYLRDGKWVDARLAAKAGDEPARVVKYGTKEYEEMRAKLAAEGQAAAPSLGNEVVTEVDGERVEMSF